MHISLKAETLFHIGSWPVNNSLLAGVIGSLLIAVVFWLGARALKRSPRSRLAQIVESLCEVIVDAIEAVTHDRAKALRFFPLLATLFIFILINNWLGLLPGVGSITVQTEEGVVPLLRGANADLNTTLALAIISVVMTQVYAVRELGVIGHLSKYFSTNPVLSFVGLLEIVSEFSKMISFSFRLFGNIFAGEVLLIVISALVPLVGPLPFFGLELFVGLIQALVFTMLSLVFLEIASSSHGGHKESGVESKLAARAVEV
ncbi:MAG TPA: F0F1 ATP synthase subunit A [Candidatus Saccharimonadales bacterium]|nr:F0F1 ATP synthase subunit A [Candidatus Saccharimonadales bacterium]